VGARRRALLCEGVLAALLKFLVNRPKKRATSRRLEQFLRQD